ncbi:patatin-like phospholipase family protein [Parvularcula oceani]|uniref:patatin-like phospholipase family protein n=1 Tax=Parvularcula oceani TaxID=1247963 RepID=UPI0004E1570A|nr:patatin-like phospholipase family protein [Parvularcula oceani]
MTDETAPPTPLKERRFALALSGGGYRATLFHLGALRRLNELGLLARTERITAVSGGALLLGYLTSRLPEVLDRSGGVPPSEWESRVSAPVHRFCKNDLRTVQTLLNFLAFGLIGRNRRLDYNIRRLSELFDDLTMGSLYPERTDADLPELYFLSTDALFGQAFRVGNVPASSKEGSGHYVIGFTDQTSDWTIGRAAATSAAFPPLLGPHFPKLDPSGFLGGELSENDKRLISHIALVDGGLYDNLGGSLVSGSTKAWFRLYSDAGNPLAYDPRLLRTPLVSLRYLQLMSNFIGRVNYKAIKATKASDFVEWSAQHPVKKPPASISIGYPKDLVDGALERIRTDLDEFTDDECRVLENHGYAQASLELAVVGSDADLPLPIWPYDKHAYTDIDMVGRIVETASKRKMLSQLCRLSPRR